MTEAQKNAARRYDAKNTRTFTIKLNYNNDKDLIDCLESADNIQGLLKDLIRGYISQSNRRK